MDDKQKALRELEGRKREDEAALREKLAALGEALLSRDGADGDEAAERRQRRALLKEQNEARTRIGDIEAAVLRRKEVEAEIAGKEEAQRGRLRELDDSYALLGMRLLEADADEGPADGASTGGSPEQTRAALVHARAREVRVKVEALERQLAELDAADGGGLGAGGSGFFARIGRGAQGLMVKAALGKSRGDLVRLYRKAGEDFFNADGGYGPLAGKEAAALAETAAGQRRQVSALGNEILQLREERLHLGEQTGANPASRIRGEERAIERAGERLREIYCAFGEAVSGGGKKKASLRKEDEALLKEVKAARELVAADDARIEKVRAAIAIDGEKAAIGKARGDIDRARRKIADCQRGIREQEANIAEREARIAELEKKL